MPDIQEAANAEINSLAKRSGKEVIRVSLKATKFTGKLLANIFKAVLETAGINVGRNNSRGGYSQENEVKHGKMDLKDLVAKDRETSFIAVNDTDTKLWDKICDEMGVDYSIQEKPALDEKGNQVLDYSKCRLVKDENGEPVMDESKCIFEKDEHGEFILDDDGNKKLTKDSPLPVPLLEETSAKPQKVFEYDIVFQAKDAKIIELAFKKYIEEHDKKIDLNKARSEKVNIKDMIKVFKDKMSEVNQDNPEKHHNRGEQSL